MRPAALAAWSQTDPCCEECGFLHEHVGILAPPVVEPTLGAVGTYNLPGIEPTGYHQAYVEEICYCLAHWLMRAQNDWRWRARTGMSGSRICDCASLSLVIVVIDVLLDAYHGHLHPHWCHDDVIHLLHAGAALGYAEVCATDPR